MPAIVTMAVAGPVTLIDRLGSRLLVELISRAILRWRGDGVHRAGGRPPAPRGGQGHHHGRRRAQPGVIPQGAANSWPGSRTSRSSPELKAFGGQVIGSTAMPLTRRDVRGSESPVKTCTHR